MSDRLDEIRKRFSSTWDCDVTWLIAEVDRLRDPAQQVKQQIEWVGNVVRERDEARAELKKLIGEKPHPDATHAWMMPPVERPPFVLDPDEFPESKLEAENDRLREMLQKAADTFADTTKFLRMIGRTVAAISCGVAETAIRRALEPSAGEEGK